MPAFDRRAVVPIRGAAHGSPVGAGVAAEWGRPGNARALRSGGAVALPHALAKRLISLCETVTSYPILAQFTMPSASFAAPWIDSLPTLRVNGLQLAPGGGGTLVIRRRRATMRRG